MAKIEKVETIRTSHPPLIDPASHYLIKFRTGSIIQIDAGADPGVGPKAGSVLITHWHWDHAYGLVGGPGVKVYMSRKTYEMIDGRKAADRMRTIIEGVIGREAWDIVKDAAYTFASRYDEIKDSIHGKHELLLLDELEKPPYESKIIQCPGHSEDHVCYLLHKKIFVGDNMVYPGSVSLVNLAQYRDTVAKILSENSWTTLYPGHGEPVSREEALRWFIKTYASKEKKLCMFMTLLGELGRLDSIIGRMYGGLDGVLYYVAARSLVGYIRALEEMGLVVVDRSSSPWIVTVTTRRLISS